MKLYRAQLYVVKDEVDYFNQKQFNKLVGESAYEKDLYIYEPIKIEIGLGRYTTNPIFQNIASYFHDGRYNFDLIVTKQLLHRVKDIATGFHFPIVEARNPMYYGLWQYEIIRVFEANQRLYAQIISEMNAEEVEQFVGSMTKEKMQNRKQLLLYAIEQTQKHWQPLPSVMGRKKQSTFVEQFNKKKLELEEEKTTRQYVKMIKQMRKQNGNN